MTRFVTRAAPALLLGTAAAGALAGAQTAPVPDAHPLGATVATIATPFGSVQAIRQLPDGRLLVNDPARRQLLLFDADLKTSTAIADSTNPAATYSGRNAGLLAYRGDSTLFVDPQSLSMLVIDPKGQVGRVMAVPRAEDAMALTGIAFGGAGFDAQGRLVYRAPPRFEFRRGPGQPGPGQPGFQMPTPPDTSPILRVELATRKVDTVAWVKSFAPKMTPRTNADGQLVGMTSVVNPLPLVDDWAVLSDGTLIVLRGREFRADLVGPDGKLVPGPKVAHDWQRMNDEEKVAFLDSTKAAQEKMRAEMQKRIEAAGGMEKVMASGNAAQVLGGGPMGGGGAGVPMVNIRIGGPDGEPPRRGAGGPNGAGGLQMSAPEYIPASELPDYKPPFAMGAARADADGNVWVRLIATKPMPGPVYDVIDKTGKLVDRVVLPANSAIAGFGPGVVYLATRDEAGTHLKKVNVK
jgi:hypothetical protein